MLLGVLISILTAVASAQSFDSFVWEHAGEEVYNPKDLVSIEGDRAWPKLKEDLKVTLKLGSSLYSDPRFANNSSLVSWWPPTASSQQCATSADLPPVTGKLLHVTQTFAIMQVDKSVDTCGSRFNSERKNKRIVFVPKSAVATIVPRKMDPSDPISEATSTAPGVCDICQLASADADMRAFVQAAKATYTSNRPNKTPEEQERYFQCYKTPHQDNYDRFYKALIEDAAKFFAVSMRYETVIDPKTKKPVIDKRTNKPLKRAVIKPIDFDDFASDENTRPQDAPVIVRTDANLMKCVALRESSWNPEDVSETGAMGLGQQTQENIDHIKCMLYGCTAYRDKWSNGKPVTDSNGKPVQEPYFREPDKWAQTIWKNYFEYQKKRLSPEKWKRLTTHPRTGQPCTDRMEIKERDALCPINSLAGLALYHIVGELQMRSSSNLHKADSGTDFSMDGEAGLSFRLTQGTTTNGGTGTTHKTIKLYQDPLEWIKRIGQVSSRPGEVGDYAKFLRNCYANNSWKPYFKPPEFISKTVTGGDGKKKVVKVPWEDPNCFTKSISQSVDQVMGAK